MEPTPAPMPAAIMIRRSRSDRLRRVARKEPNPAPIWAMGPSRPPDPPVVRVMAEQMVLMTGTRGRIKPPVMIGVDGGVSAVALRLRSEGVNEPAAEQTPGGGQDQQSHRLRGGSWGEEMVLAGRGRRPVPGQHVHKIVNAELAEVVKDDGAGPRDEPDDHEIGKPLPGIGINRPGAGQPARRRSSALAPGVITRPGCLEWPGKGCRTGRGCSPRPPRRRRSGCRGARWR